MPKLGGGASTLLMAIYTAERTENFWMATEITVSVSFQVASTL